MTNVTATTVEQPPPRPPPVPRRPTTRSWRIYSTNSACSKRTPTPYISNFNNTHAIDETPPTICWEELPDCNSNDYLHHGSRSPRLFITKTKRFVITVYHRDFSPLMTTTKCVFFLFRFDFFLLCHYRQYFATILFTFR